MSEEIHRRFIRIAQNLSPQLAHAIAQTQPLQLISRRETPLPEVLCRTITGQQLSVKAASSIWAKIMTKTKTRSLVDYLAVVEINELRACGLSAAKSKAMQRIALAALAGELEVEELSAMDYRDRTQHLTALWGVGQWTADMMSIFYFGNLDIWPEGDTTARKNLERLTSRRRKTIRTAAHFAPHRSYLALYMWQQANPMQDVSSRDKIKP